MKNISWITFILKYILGGEVLSNLHFKPHRKLFDFHFVQLSEIFLRFKVLIT